MPSISRPSAPASQPRHIPGGTRTASHSSSSTISSSTFIRPLPRTTTYTSSCFSCVWPYGKRLGGRAADVFVLGHERRGGERRSLWVAEHRESRVGSVDGS